MNRKTLIIIGVVVLGVYLYMTGIDSGTVKMIIIGVLALVLLVMSIIVTWLVYGNEDN